jgi:tight adherence protein C
MNLDSLLPAGLSPEDLIIAMSALTAFVSAFAVWSALLYRDPAARRAELMATQREALRAGVSASRRRKDRDHSLTFMRQVVDRLQLMKSSQAEKINNNLARAGWRTKDAPS